MFCEHCGREILEKCICLRTNRIRWWESGLILLAMLVIPVHFLVRESLGVSVFSIDFILISNMVLSTILLILTILHFTFKRPYLALFFGCHQRVERSFQLFGKNLPLCSRCTGIYLGTFLVLAVNYYFDFPFYIYLIAGVPLLVDGLLQRYSQYTSTNSRRFITGLLFSLTLVYLFSLYNALVVTVAKWIITLF